MEIKLNALINQDENTEHVIWPHAIQESNISYNTVAIYGMGFVGLTLACVMAKSGFLVKGVDINETVIEALRQNRPHFFENGLESMLKSLGTKNRIDFTCNILSVKADIHIISVGTPVKSDQSIDIESILAITHKIAENLQQGNTVIYRSTLPVGATRNIFLPILEKKGLVAGSDFYLVFCPERTVEGDALRELEFLPQIVGGINKKSVEQGTKIFRKVTPSVIEVESLEAAEMIKIMNNTFRDLVFAFSNEVSKICDDLNINAFRLIETANKGYPRNKIPKPSPGVGGMCLTKDPYLYSSPMMKTSFSPIIGKISREINVSMYDFIINKLNAFCIKKKLKLKQCKIFIIGLAFKGYPETSDIRGSCALDLINRLPNRKLIFVKDFVVNARIIHDLDLVAIKNIEDGFNDATIVLVLNNHYLNNKFELGTALGRMSKPALLFDGWDIFKQEEVESFSEISYATLGYMTPNA